MAELPPAESISELSPDAGAAFVLESKGQWWHAGFHLTTAIVGPPILTLPFAFRGLGWGVGFVCLTIMAAVTFYSYYLLSKVLELCEKQGRRHIRFRELAADVLGSGWMLYFVVFIQAAVNTGVGVAAILLGGECLELPSFHSLRYINFVSLLLSLAYAFLIAFASILAGTSDNVPSKGYSLESTLSARLFTAFTSISIFAAIFGNGILPEIQATLAPPVGGKMVKGLIMCYIVIFITFYSSAASGYWVFGNESNSNILKNLLPKNRSPLAPTWILLFAVLFILLQLLAIGMVYAQVAYEIMEKRSADAKQGVFSRRNLIPRLILRTLYMSLCGFFAAMFPFFGDINSIVGAIGFIPLDFVLPMVLYNITHKPPVTSITYWVNVFIVVAFSGVGLLGCFASIRNLVLDAKKFKLFSSHVV
ncbi:putative GABA transporter 2 [Cucurbita argyrosperma subsp. argyrosperma]